MPVYGYISHSEDGVLCHHGVKGQKWGIRRYQNADGTLTAAGRQRYGVSRIKNDRFGGLSSLTENSIAENRIFNRARRDKYRQYVEDLKNGQFLKNYRKTNKAFDKITEQAIQNYRKQYSPEELYKRQSNRRYSKKLAAMSPIYGIYGAAHFANNFNDDFTAAKWNRDRFNPYRDTHKLIENRDYIYSNRNKPVFDINKSEFENRVAAKRYLDDQKKQKKEAKEAAKKKAAELRSRYYD